MDIENLRCFIEVSSCGNFTKAAEKMFMVQSTVSRRVQRLERELGVTLVARDAPAFQLTKQGRLVYERGRRILDEIASLEACVHDEGELAQGSVSVGFYGLLNHLDIIRALKAYLEKRYPLVRLDVFYSKVGDMAEDMRRKRFDVAVAPLCELPGKGYVRRTLVERRLIALVPKAHGLARRDSIVAKDLRDEPLVFWKREVVPGFYDALVDQCERAGFSPRFAELHEVEDAIVMSVSSGAGVSVLFDQTFVPVGDDIVQIPIEGMSIPVDVAFAYEQDRRDAGIAAVSRAFEWLSSKDGAL